MGLLKRVLNAGASLRSVSIVKVAGLVTALATPSLASANNMQHVDYDTWAASQGFSNAPVTSVYEPAAASGSGRILYDGAVETTQPFVSNSLYNTSPATSYDVSSGQPAIGEIIYTAMPAAPVAQPALGEIVYSTMTAAPTVQPINTNNFTSYEVVPTAPQALAPIATTPLGDAPTEAGEIFTIDEWENRDNQAAINATALPQQDIWHAEMSNQSIVKDHTGVTTTHNDGSVSWEGYSSSQVLTPETVAKLQQRGHKTHGHGHGHAHAAHALNPNVDISGNEAQNGSYEAFYTLDKTKNYKVFSEADSRVWLAENFEPFDNTEAGKMFEQAYLSLGRYEANRDVFSYIRGKLNPSKFSVKEGDRSMTFVGTNQIFLNVRELTKFPFPKEGFGYSSASPLSIEMHEVIHNLGIVSERATIALNNDLRVINKMPGALRAEGGHAWASPISLRLLASPEEIYLEKIAEANAVINKQYAAQQQANGNRYAQAAPQKSTQTPVHQATAETVKRALASTTSVVASRVASQRPQYQPTASRIVAQSTVAPQAASGVNKPAVQPALYEGSFRFAPRLGSQRLTSEEQRRFREEARLSFRANPTAVPNVSAAVKARVSPGERAILSNIGNPNVQLASAGSVSWEQVQSERDAHYASLAASGQRLAAVKTVPTATSEVAFRTTYEKPSASNSTASSLSQSFSNIGSQVTTALTGSAEANPYLQKPYLFDGTQEGAIAGNFVNALTSGAEAEGGRMGGFNFASDDNTSVIGYTVSVANDWHATGFVRASSNFKADPSSQYASLGEAGTLNSELGLGLGVSRTFKHNNVSGAVSLIGGIDQVTSAEVVNVGGQYAATGNVSQKLNPTLWVGGHLKF